MRSLIRILFTATDDLKFTSHKVCISLLIALLALGPASWAQTQKGNHLVGMQVAELSFSFKNLLQSTISLSPAYGRFIGSNLAIGLELPFYHIYSDFNQSPRHTTQIALTPLVRYYFGQQWYQPFISLLVGPRYTEQSLYLPRTSQTRFESATDILYGLRGGVAFFINKRISLDLSPSYIPSTKLMANDFIWIPNALGYDEANKLAANIGFQLYLNRNKRY